MTGGSLAVGESCTFSVALDIPLGMANGTYTNTTGEITGMIEGQTVSGKPATDDVQVIAAPKLRKSFTDDPVFPGDTVTLEFTISHDENAPGDATAISFTDDLDAALSGADCLAVVTKHREYFQLDLAKAKKLMRTPIIVDGRDVIDKKRAERAGFLYKGIGKGK